MRVQNWGEVMEGAGISEPREWLWIVSSDDGPETRAGGWRSVPVDEFAKQLADCLGAVQGAITSAAKVANVAQLSKVQLSMTVSATGKLGLLGSGAEATAQAAIVLEFEPRYSCSD